MVSAKHGHGTAAPPGFTGNADVRPDRQLTLDLPPQRNLLTPHPALSPLRGEGEELDWGRSSQKRRDRSGWRSLKRAECARSGKMRRTKCERPADWETGATGTGQCAVPEASAPGRAATAVYWFSDVGRELVVAGHTKAVSRLPPCHRTPKRFLAAQSAFDLGGWLGSNRLCSPLFGIIRLLMGARGEWD
jgi:hypothetical protein